MERLTLDDMIKALKCVASQDTVGDCYVDHENFMHMNDGEYKRIVCRAGEDLRDPISDKEAVGCPYYQNTYGCCFENGELYWLKDVAELLEELKSYKDLEEQGLLVRLPCKAGDDVYIIPSPPIYGLNIFYGCENVNRVYHQHIESITFAGSHWYATGRNEYKEKVLNDTAFGTTWFLTREEAENKLEEMKKK